MSGFDEDEKPELKLIVTKYDGHCTKKGCERFLPAGSSAYYGKTPNGDSVLICTVCQTSVGVGRGLANKYQKIRELNVVIRELTEKANDLSDEVSDLESETNLKEMAFKIETLLNKTSDFLNSVGLGDAELKQFKELMEFLRSVQDEWGILRNIVQSRLHVKRKRKIIAT